MQQVERVQNDIAELERQIGEMHVREVANTQQLHAEIWSKNILLQQQERQFQGEIDSQHDKIQRMRGEI